MMAAKQPESLFYFCTLTVEEVSRDTTVDLDRQYVFYIHHSESRWLATPKKWRFLRGHDKPRLLGVAPSTFQVV